jgi:hypothetical protein
MPLALDPKVSSPRLVVQRLNPLEYPDWDQLLMTHPGYTFFHCAAWARVLHDTYRNIPSYFAIIEKPEVRSQKSEVSPLPPGLRPLTPDLCPLTSARLLGLFPVMEANSPILGRRAFSLPYSDECQPLVSNSPSPVSRERVGVRATPSPPSGERAGVRGPDMFQHLWQEAIDYGKSRRWKYLVCHGGNGLFGNTPPSLTFYGHVLDLSAGEDELFAQFDRQVRQGIRKAEKSNIAAEISNCLEGIETYYSLQCLTRKKHGLPPQPFSFFANIQKHIIDNRLGCVVIGRLEEKAIAASVLFHLGDRIICKYAASDESFLQLRGNNLVMWEAIKWSVRNGYKKFDFGKSSINNAGLRRYKLGWGPAESIIEYFRYDLRKAAFTADRDRVEGWHNLIFRLMPSSLARLAGTILYKWLS